MSVTSAQGKQAAATDLQQIIYQFTEPHPQQSCILTHNIWPQASQDGQVWVDLRRHADDRSLSLPGQFASWPVGGLPALRAYRCFRVLLAQGPAAATTHASELSLSHFELYGWATRNQGQAGMPA
jgi:hypothetical protein